MMDRSQFATLLAGLCLACGVSNAAAQKYTAKQTLALKPLQADAVYESVPADQVDQCKVLDVNENGQRGWEVVGPDGATLRRFVDTNNDQQLDQWSYFQFGIESYRDVDSDFDNKADQYRWLGNGGTRWGLDRDEDGQIDAWKRISAEEVSAEVLAAIRDGNADRFRALLATPREIEALGLGDEKADQVISNLRMAASDFADIAAEQRSIGPDAQWLQFAAPAPGIYPVGTNGSSQDVLVYENVVAMFDNAGKSGQLMVGSLVKVGDAWRLVSLPLVGEDAIGQTSGLFFTSPGTSGNSLVSDSKTQELVTDLEAIDQQLAAAKPGTSERLHAARAGLVEQLIASATTPEERRTWVRQLIDTVGVAVQSGEYPKGLQRMKTIAKQFAGNDRGLAAYANYQAIQTEYVSRQTPDAEFEKVQKWYLDSLDVFVDAHPRTLEAAQAMLQLALAKEFEDKEKEALAYYRQVRDLYEGSEVGEKAAGAVRRLESVGRQIELRGTTIDGRPFQLSKLRGRPVLIHYWATWCEPCKQDMKLINRLMARYKRAGLTPIGINVDARREDAEQFLKTNRLPWIQLFEEGGLESSQLSKAFGVQTLPTMMLVDKSGKVVAHNITAAQLDDQIDAMLKKK
ncbi:MAG: TlpA disulfide reductase family protein [Planctomycetota bacterium]